MEEKIPFQQQPEEFPWSVRKPAVKKPLPVSVNMVLFILTLGSTWFVGITQYIAFNFPDINFATIKQMLNIVLNNPSLITDGLYFSFAIMFFLLAHEMGHYLTCRYYNINATLPYFIPFPSIVGTLGAVIKIRSPMKNKRVLFDIGIAGPLAGFAVALPTMIYGIMMSKPIPPLEAAQGAYITLGDPIIFKIFQNIIFPALPENYDIVLHPLGFVGWFGCLATCINLLPVSQLDGGHIAYAIFGKYYPIISKIIFFAVLVMGVITRFLGWIVWGALVLFLFKLRHPPTLNDEIQIGTARKVLGFIALLLLLLTFTPKPIYIS